MLIQKRTDISLTESIFLFQIHPKWVCYAHGLTPVKEWKQSLTVWYIRIHRQRYNFISIILGAISINLIKFVTLKGQVEISEELFFNYVDNIYCTVKNFIRKSTDWIILLNERLSYFLIFYISLRKNIIFKIYRICFLVPFRVYFVGFSTLPHILV